MQAKSLIRRKQCMHFFYNNSPTMRSSGVIVCNSLKCYLNCKIINAQLAAEACTLFFLYSLDLASLADRLSVDRHRPVNWEHAPLSLPPTVLSFEKNVIDRVKLANHLQLCGGRVPECNVYICRAPIGVEQRGRGSRLEERGKTIFYPSDRAAFWGSGGGSGSKLYM